MWCANCRGTYLAVRRLRADLRVVDPRRKRGPVRFSTEKLRRSLVEPLRKPSGEGIRDPNTLDHLPETLWPLANDFVVDFVTERLANIAPEPNGQVTTDQIASIAMAGLFRSYPLAYLRCAVHHRMIGLAATPEEWEELTSIADDLAAAAHAHTEPMESEPPLMREPLPPVLCPRCETPRVARRSRASVVRHLNVQPASCNHCGQRYTWEWGSQIPMLITSAKGDTLFDFDRFRAGIRHSVRKLPGKAIIWSDERLIVSAGVTALISAAPFIRPPSDDQLLPSINASDIWLAAASALRAIHPLASVRFVLHSGAVGALDWETRERAADLKRMLGIVEGIGQRYFRSRSFPATA
jgi:transcriptional regulator NrdR family protein